MMAQQATDASISKKDILQAKQQIEQNSELSPEQSAPLLKLYVDALSAAESAEARYLTGWLNVNS